MTNRTAFVTGASRGIGLACARALAGAGCRVVLAARDAAKLEQASAEIPNSCWVELDLASPPSIERAFAKAGKVDILINNAAVTKDGLALRMKKEAWDAVLATNLTGAFLAIQQVLHPMLRERWGRIVNISSVVGEAGNPGQANYVASKAGLIGLTKSLAQELASRNVTVNAVAPGFIETDMTASLSQELKDAMLSRIPLNRFGKAEEVAAAVKFLASDDASYITGQVLRVNGGMYM
ncbi:MAG TPA: 3-oxoacyl-[acyl-carrier-protein] reductase [Bryobacteraceae bacterium]|nr:3-oxoacyl-[acyl-carrier-protein] reductase [Bryobacteraceae bacterium]